MVECHNILKHHNDVTRCQGVYHLFFGTNLSKFAILPHSLRAIEECLDRPIGYSPVGPQHCFVDESQLLQYLKRASMSSDPTPKKCYKSDALFMWFIMIHVSRSKSGCACRHPGNDFGQKSSAGALGICRRNYISEVHWSLSEQSPHIIMFFYKRCMISCMIALALASPIASAPLPVGSPVAPG